MARNSSGPLMESLSEFRQTRFEPKWQRERERESWTWKRTRPTRLLFTLGRACRGEARSQRSPANCCEPCVPWTLCCCGRKLAENPGRQTHPLTRPSTPTSTHTHTQIFMYNQFVYFFFGSSICSKIYEASARAKVA